MSFRFNFVVDGSGSEQESLEQECTVLSGETEKQTSKIVASNSPENQNRNENGDDEKTGDVVQQEEASASGERTTETDDSDSTKEEPAEEVVLNWDNVRRHQVKCQEISLSDTQTLSVIAGKSVQKSVHKVAANSRVSLAFQEHSDLLPHIYEGGMKIWECSIDLAQYVSGLQLALRGMKVLELGCGAGLPGLVALLGGAHVTFQDYNKEVLRIVTARNIVLNDSAAEGFVERCQLISGDWSHVQELLESRGQKYDLILTSETLYCKDSYDKLHNILKALLKKEGSIYVASKTYYFGVGGGTKSFETLLDERKTFNHENCQTYDEGVPREILKLTFKE